MAIKPGFPVDNPEDPHEVRASFPGGGSHVSSRRLGQTHGRSHPLACELTSLSAVRNVDWKVRVDADITELDLSATRTYTNRKTKSPRRSLSHDGMQSLTWVAGAVSLWRGRPSTDRPSMCSGSRGSRLGSSLAWKPDAGAVSDGLRSRLAPRVAVTAGLRYTHERKTIDNAGALCDRLADRALVAEAYAAD